MKRFWDRVEKTDSCWIWQGSKNTKGYGNMKIEGCTRTTHRLSWEIHFGPIPDGKHVLHRCDNRPCVRPDHLFLGTNADNIRDMYSKGRGAKTRIGKLTKEEIYTIKEWYECNTITDLANAFGVTRHTIYKALSSPKERE